VSGDDTGRRRIVPVRADLATAEGVETRVTQVRSSVVPSTPSRSSPVSAWQDRSWTPLWTTTSVAATMPGPWYATYAASKAFVPSFA